MVKGKNAGKKIAVNLKDVVWIYVSIWNAIHTLYIIPSKAYPKLKKAHQSPDKMYGHAILSTPSIKSPLLPAGWIFINELWIDVLTNGYFLLTRVSNTLPYINKPYLDPKYCCSFSCPLSLKWQLFYFVCHMHYQSYHYNWNLSILYLSEMNKLSWWPP